MVVQGSCLAAACAALGATWRGASGLRHQGRSARYPLGPPLALQGWGWATRAGLAGGGAGGERVCEGVAVESAGNAGDPSVGRKAEGAGMELAGP